MKPSKYVALLVGLFFFISSHLSLSQVLNGDFESWSNNTPNNWSTIDSGISLSRFSSSGDNLARFTVNTSTQSNTDFRQTVSLQANQTYTFSASVYHTEGGVRARLYVDGYRNYSNPDIVNQWQTIEFSYTPSQSGTVEVGLRFYDVSGFDGSEYVYVDDYLASSSGGDSGGGYTGNAPDDYYESAAGLNGQSLKTALYNIISGHAVQGYGALWNFIGSYELDYYYENDGSVLDIYSERPSGIDAYSYRPITDQCVQTSSDEGACYNREHLFPRSWFGGSIEPMNSDVHHIYASDGRLNTARSNHPFGEVSNASYTTTNGSQVGTGNTSLGYSGTVFEPIDEFKGDIARAQFYVATRYQNLISDWDDNSPESDAILNGTSTTVFEPWYLNLLLDWHEQDPVSDKERDRNDNAFSYQGNRNPFVDNPSFVNLIWPN